MDQKSSRKGFPLVFTSVGAVFGVKGRLGGMVELEGKEWRLGNGEGWDE
jgi:hypothetical protein